MGNSTRTISLKFTGDIADLVAAAGGVDASLKKVNKTASDTSGFDQFNKSLGDVSKNISLLPVAIAAAAPLAGAAIVASLGLALAGGAVLIQSNNDQVVASFSDLRTNVVSGLKGITSDAVPVIVGAAKSLQTEFTAVKPQLAEAFQAAEPGIQIMTTGINTMITNLMPGLVRGAQASNTVLGGMSVLLGDIGVAGTNMLTGLSQGAGKFAGLLGQTGTTIENVGSIVGRVLPAMSSGIGSTLYVVNALTAGIAAVGPAVGLVAGYVPDALLGFKAFALVSGWAGSAVQGIQSMASSVLDLGANAEKSSPKLASMLGNIAFAADDLAVPFIGAVIGASVVLGTLAAVMGQTAISSADLTQTQTNLTNALTASNGAMTAATTNSLITSSGYKDLQASAKTAGVSQQQLVAAITQGGSAYDNLQKKLQGVTNAGVTYTSNGRVATTQTTAAGEAAQNLSQGLGQLRGTYSDAASAAQAAADANRALAQSAPPAYLNVQTLAANTKLFGDATQSASARLNAFTADIKLLGENGKETANDAISGLYSQLNALAASLKGTTGALFDASGNLSLTSTKGEQARTTFESMATQLADYNQALVNQGSSQQDANAQTQTTIDQMAGPLAKQLGVSKQKVLDLINTYYSVPPAVNTQVNADTGPARDAIMSIVQWGNQQLVTLGVTTAGAGSATSQHRATGGPVMAGRTYLVGDGLGPELFTPNQNGSIRSANDTRQELSATDSGGVTVHGDLVFPVDLGGGVQQVIRISNRQLVAAARAKGAGR